MIHRIRQVTGKPVGIKAVIGQSEWLEELCLGIHARGLDYAPDFFTVDSADGGTGAAPQSLIDYMGLPIQRSLPLVVDALVRFGLRDRIRVICSGKLVNPAGVAAALCLGADCVNSARGFMFDLGCVQALQCNKNTCPTGITTHDEDLQKGPNLRCLTGATPRSSTSEARRNRSAWFTRMRKPAPSSDSCPGCIPSRFLRGHTIVPQC